MEWFWLARRSAGCLVVVVVVAAVGVVSGALAGVARAQPLHSPTLVSPQPTSLALTLDGESQSGATLTVADGASVSATTVLAGAGALTARGAVTYTIYSDPGCTQPVVSAGSRHANQGIDSRAVRLTPGTYYWQATYGGDAADEPSASPCGANVETVEGTPLPNSCTGIAGLTRFQGETGPVVLRAELSTDLATHERLYAWWPGLHRLRITRLRGAWCVARPKADVFRGVGDARLDGNPGYFVSFSIVVSRYGEPSLRLRVRGPGREAAAIADGVGPVGTQVLQ